MSNPSDLVQGTLSLLVLKVLALESLNGWAISLMRLGRKELEIEAANWQRLSAALTQVVELKGG